MRVWINGRLLLDPNEPVLRVTDHGFTVGDGVFEAVKVVNGQPFALTRHLSRLTRSAKGLHLPAPDEAWVREGVVPDADAPAPPPSLGAEQRQARAEGLGPHPFTRPEQPNPPEGSVL